MTESWWNFLDENWLLFNQIYPAPGLEPERLRAFRPDIVGYIGNMYASSDPRNLYAQYSYNADIVQTAFTALGGGNPLTWTSEMRVITEEFLQAPNSLVAIGAGVMHCVRPQATRACHLRDFSPRDCYDSRAFRGIARDLRDFSERSPVFAGICLRDYLVADDDLQLILRTRGRRREARGMAAGDR